MLYPVSDRLLSVIDYTCNIVTTFTHYTKQVAMACIEREQTGEQVYYVLYLEGDTFDRHYEYSNPIRLYNCVLISE